MLKIRANSRGDRHFPTPCAFPRDNWVSGPSIARSMRHSPELRYGFASHVRCNRCHELRIRIGYGSASGGDCSAREWPAGEADARAGISTGCVRARLARSLLAAAWTVSGSLSERRVLFAWKRRACPEPLTRYALRPVKDLDE